MRPDSKLTSGSSYWPTLSTEKSSILLLLGCFNKQANGINRANQSIQSSHAVPPISVATRTMYVQRTYNMYHMYLVHIGTLFSLLLIVLVWGVRGASVWCVLCSVSVFPEGIFFHFRDVGAYPVTTDWIFGEEWMWKQQSVDRSIVHWKPIKSISTTAAATQQSVDRSVVYWKSIKSINQINVNNSSSNINSSRSDDGNSNRCNHAT